GRGGAGPGRGPPPAVGAPRDEGPAAADRAGDPAPSRPGGEGPGDSQRLRTGLEGGGVLRPERRGGPDLASAGPGRPDEGRLPRGPDVRAERGRGGTAPRGPDSGGTTPTRDSKAAVGHCGVCRSRRVTFQDDGWGRCAECGNSFRWRGPLGVLERLRDLLTP